MIDIPRNFKVEPDVEEFIEKAGKDFRLCTTCGGPAIVPTAFKAEKESDIRIPIGENILFVSKVQAKYLREINMRMLAGHLRTRSKD
ncbi:hypothetical protein V7O66_08750 [Methanolobus sp. ZRKC3]|uniref:hypothetical protein n=1 Tax=Methanolobus sp. ZRKC3 TaxID=3125786 RepID=UPI003251C154